MFRTAAGFLLAGGLAALLSLMSGCSSQGETISERRKRVEAENEAAAAPEEGADAAVPADGGDDAPAGETPETKARATGRTPAAGRNREESILDDLAEELSLRKQEARFHASRGDDLFGQNRYEEAIVEYEQALALDPSLDQARQRMNDAKVLTGERSGEIGAVKSALVDERRVQKEQRLIEIDRSLKEAKKALDANDVDRAEDLVTQALFELNLEPDLDVAKRREAETLLARIRDEKLVRDREREAAMLRQAREKVEQDVALESATRRQQVQELLRKAAEFIRIRDYEKAIEACERVIDLDPGNLVAKFWINDSRDQIVRERRQRLISDRLENHRLTEESFVEGTVAYEQNFVFPDDAHWANVRRRGQDTGFINVEDPEQVRRTKNALEGTRVDFNFEATPLEDVVRQLRTFTGANMTIDPGVDASTITVTMKIDNLSALSALNLILENVGLTYTFRENVLYITNPGQQGGRTEFAIYNVADILNKIRDFEGPALIMRPSGDTSQTPITFTADSADEEATLDPDTLKTLIEESTGGTDVWAEPNSMEFHAGQFLVNAPRELHAELQQVLENLRKDSDLFVVIEARFIDVNDDFLEDIGVDYRALGAVNNYGTPFGNIINDNTTGGQDLGFVQQGNPVNDVELIMGQDRWAGRAQHILDGFSGLIRGTSLTGGNAIGGLTVQWTILEPFQVNVILRAVQERANVRQLTAPVVTAHNGQRVFVSIITQRAYIADYNLVSGGTGFSIIEVADPEVQTFQEGVILDVDPVISHDKKYVTLDVRPTLATLINGVISTILISLGSFTSVAFMVPIGIPEIALQEAFTSVTVPNGGTVLLGGFKSLNEAKFMSYVPILGRVPILNFLFRRKAQVVEKRSLVILLSVRIVDLRGEESKIYNPQ